MFKNDVRTLHKFVEEFIEKMNIKKSWHYMHCIK